jgi:hypothetical protein
VCIKFFFFLKKSSQRDRNAFSALITNWGFDNVGRCESCESLSSAYPFSETAVPFFFHEFDNVRQCESCESLCMAYSELGLSTDPIGAEHRPPRVSIQLRPTAAPKAISG